MSFPKGISREDRGSCLCSGQTVTPSSWLRWGIPLNFTWLLGGSIVFLLLRPSREQNSGLGYVRGLNQTLASE